MAAGRFTISQTNPNESIGGGGCLCNPLKIEDQAGPFAIFPASETDNNVSPHVVICVGCAEQFCSRVRSGEEGLAPGQGDVIEATAVEETDNEGELEL